jgi:hypothetical protein
LRWISDCFNTGFIHTLEKERRTCLSFLVFGEDFTAKDAKVAKENGRSASHSIQCHYSFVFSFPEVFNAQNAKLGRKIGSKIMLGSKDVGMEWTSLLEKYFSVFLCVLSVLCGENVSGLTDSN